MRLSVKLVAFTHSGWKTPLKSRAKIWFVECLQACSANARTRSSNWRWLASFASWERVLQNQSLSAIQEEWFAASSRKLSSVSQVEDYLSSFSEISSHLLLQIVNMADANVSERVSYEFVHVRINLHPVVCCRETRRCTTLCRTARWTWSTSSSTLAPSTSTNRTRLATLLSC